MSGKSVSLQTIMIVGSATGDCTCITRVWNDERDPKGGVRLNFTAHTGVWCVDLYGITSLTKFGSPRPCNSKTLKMSQQCTLQTTGNNREVDWNAFAPFQALSCRKKVAKASYKCWMITSHTRPKFINVVQTSTYVGATWGQVKVARNVIELILSDKQPIRSVPFQVQPGKGTCGTRDRKMWQTVIIELSKTEWGLQSFLHLRKTILSDSVWNVAVHYSNHSSFVSHNFHGRMYWLS